MAISANTPVLTTNLWLQAKDLRPGDYVYGLDGQPKKIYSVQDISPTETYKVTLDDGIVIRGDKNLTLPLEDLKYRINLCEFENREGKVRNTKRKAELRRKTLVEMLEAGLYIKGKERKFSIPTSQPIQYQTQALVVPPFVAGLWFSKMRRGNKLWMEKKELKEFERRMRLNRFSIHKIKNDGTKTYFEVRPHIGISFLADPRHVAIPTKIPQEYFFGSPEQRIEFLQGFFRYRKCYNKKRNRIELDSRDIHIIRKIQAIVESLGIKTRTEFSNPLKIHKLYFKTSIKLHPEQQVEQHVAKFTRRFVSEIEKVEPTPCVHIEAEAPFLIGTEGFIAIC